MAEKSDAGSPRHDGRGLPLGIVGGVTFALCSCPGTPQFGSGDYSFERLPLRSRSAAPKAPLKASKAMATNRILAVGDAPVAVPRPDVGATGVDSMTAAMGSGIGVSTTIGSVRPGIGVVSFSGGVGGGGVRLGGGSFRSFRKRTV